MAEDINLGDVITLKGFNEEEGSTMIIVKKMVGSYIKKIMDDHREFQESIVTLKRIHEHQEKGEAKGGKSEVHVKINAGRVFAAENTDFNLFVALDKAFKKVSAEM
jgi:ribosome-associated translation inhibitor RaiA